MKSRHHPASLYASLKAMTKRFIDQAFGAQKVAAGVTRVDQQAISDYGSTSPDKAERFMPIDVMVDLIDASGDTSLLRHIAETVNCLLVPLPRGEAVDALTEGSIRSSQDFAAMMAEILASLADRRISPAEGVVIRRKIRTLMLDLVAMHEAVDASTARDEA